LPRTAKPAPEYAFKGQSVNLIQRDLDCWRQKFDRLPDFDDSLRRADESYFRKGLSTGRAFHTIHNWLAKENETAPEPGKLFWQRPKGRKTFYNSDVLDDPSLQDDRAALVIVEGEMDCLSVLEAGYPFVVSVPDGATRAQRERQPDQGSRRNGGPRSRSRRYVPVHSE
jgi:Toprim domain